MPNWLVLLLTLTGTYPTVNCAGGPLESKLAYRQLWVQRQSPTWVAKHLVMEANPDSFAFYQPTVGAEAAPRMVSRTPITGLEGKPFSITPPNLGWTTQTFWFIICENDSGRAGCHNPKIVGVMQ